jgi:hypothetical protein
LHLSGLLQIAARPGFSCAERIQLANIAGLATLAVIMAIGAAVAGYAPSFIPPFGGLQGWLAIYALAAFLSLCTWRSKHWPDTAGGALGGAVILIFMGAFSFFLDVTFGQHEHPALAAMAAAQTQGLGFAITLLCCPGLTAIFLAGSVRNFVRSRETSRQRSALDSGRTYPSAFLKAGEQAIAQDKIYFLRSEISPDLGIKGYRWSLRVVKVGQPDGHKDSRGSDVLKEAQPAAGAYLAFASKFLAESFRRNQANVSVVCSDQLDHEHYFDFFRMRLVLFETSAQVDSCLADRGNYPYEKLFARYSVEEGLKRNVA